MHDETPDAQELTWDDLDARWTLADYTNADIDPDDWAGPELPLPRGLRFAY